MFTHYLKIALRNLLKNKIQSAISIIGLMVGFVCITLSAIWIYYEMTYDTLHPNASHICQIIAIEPDNADDFNYTMPAPLAGKLKGTFAEIEAATTVCTWVSNKIVHNNAIVDKCYMADADFFDVFSPTFILGDKEKAFSSQFSIVLTESTANELFGSPEKAMNAIIMSQDYRSDKASNEYIVTGVIKNFKHSFIDFKAICKFTPTDNDHWHSSSFRTYIRVANSLLVDDFNNKLKETIIEEVHKNGFNAIPIAKIPYKYPPNDSTRPLPLIYIIILSAISLLLFICALFNHLSLFVSLMFMRLKDLSLRRAIGARSKQLFILLLTEFCFSLLIAFALSTCVIELIRPTMALVINVDLEASIVFGSILLISLLGIIISIIIACYPIWRTCKTVVKTGIVTKNTNKRQRLQKILITIQLIISIFFLSITSIMYKQLHFMHNQDLGFNRENVIRIKPDELNKRKFGDNVDIICNELEESAAIEAVLKQRIEFFAYDGVSTTNGINWEGKAENLKIYVASIWLDYNFTEFFGVPILEGRYYSKDFTNDKKLVVNEKLANIIGNPIGKQINYQGTDMEIIGVMANFHDRSLKYESMPTAINLNTGASFLYVRTTQGNQKQALEHIGKVFEKHGIPSFQSQTMDDYFDDFSKAENTMMRFISIISAVCLIISIFGVFSLTSYSMQRRKREVAVRKVMGASVSDIIRMFFKEYVWLVVIASIIAIPPAYYIMDKWLQGYANRINIEWWLIAGIIISILLIVIITVLRQIVKAANSNPAEVIKYE